MFQALNAGTDHLEGPAVQGRPARGPRDARASASRCGFVDWEENGDPFFYENHHLSPRPVEGSRTESGEEHWIFYNTTKFSGKKLVVRPGSHT